MLTNTASQGFIYDPPGRSGDGFRKISGVPSKAISNFFGSPRSSDVRRFEFVTVVVCGIDFNPVCNVLNSASFLPGKVLENQNLDMILWEQVQPGLEVLVVVTV